MSKPLIVHSAHGFTTGDTVDINATAELVGGTLKQIRAWFGPLPRKIKRIESYSGGVSPEYSALVFDEAPGYGSLQNFYIVKKAGGRLQNKSGQVNDRET